MSTDIGNRLFYHRNIKIVDDFEKDHWKKRTSIHKGLLDHRPHHGGEGGTPILSDRGYPRVSPSQVRSQVRTKGVYPGQDWVGVPPSGLDGVNPPPVGTGWRYPPPIQDWMGVTPPSPGDRAAERALATWRAVCLLPLAFTQEDFLVLISLTAAKRS